MMAMCSVFDENFTVELSHGYRSVWTVKYSTVSALCCSRSVISRPTASGIPACAAYEPGGLTVLFDGCVPMIVFVYQTAVLCPQQALHPQAGIMPNEGSGLPRSLAADHRWWPRRQRPLRPGLLREIKRQTQYQRLPHEWGLGKGITEAKSYHRRNSAKRRLRTQNLVTRRASTHQLAFCCYLVISV
jgi:hypothetical protein